MFSRAVALLSYRFTSSKRPPDVVSLFMRKKYACLKLKLPTQNKELIIFPFLTVNSPLRIWAERLVKNLKSSIFSMLGRVPCLQKNRKGKVSYVT